MLQAKDKLPHCSCQQASQDVNMYTISADKSQCQQGMFLTGRTPAIHVMPESDLRTPNCCSIQFFSGESSNSGDLHIIDGCTGTSNNGGYRYDLVFLSSATIQLLFLVAILVLIQILIPITHTRTNTDPRTNTYKTNTHANIHTNTKTTANTSTNINTT